MRHVKGSATGSIRRGRSPTRRGFNRPVCGASHGSDRLAGRPYFSRMPPTEVAQSRNWVAPSPLPSDRPSQGETQLCKTTPENREPVAIFRPAVEFVGLHWNPTSGTRPRRLWRTARSGTSSFSVTTSVTRSGSASGPDIPSTSDPEPERNYSAVVSPYCGGGWAGGAIRRIT